MISSSVLNGLLLPFVLVFALSLINKKKIMGEYINSKAQNYISWATVVALVVLTGAMISMSILPALN